MEKMDEFATVAFSFVLGYAQRLLNNESKMRPCKFDGRGDLVPTGEKTDATKSLETTVKLLNHLWDVWNGKC